MQENRDKRTPLTTRRDLQPDVTSQIKLILIGKNELSPTRHLSQDCPRGLQLGQSCADVQPAHRLDTLDVGHRRQRGLSVAPGSSTSLGERVGHLGEGLAPVRVCSVVDPPSAACQRGGRPACSPCHGPPSTARLPHIALLASLKRRIQRAGRKVPTGPCLSGASTSAPGRGRALGRADAPAHRISGTASCEVVPGRIFDARMRVGQRA